jgi:hypothetical protein
MIYSQGFMDSGTDETLSTTTNNENDLIVVAHEFDQGGGHGILASPHTFAAYYGCGDNKYCSNFRVVKGATNNGGHDVKNDVLLCAQGYSGPNCAKKCQECQNAKQKLNASGSCVDKNFMTADEMTNKKDVDNTTFCWQFSDIAQYQACMRRQ